MKRFLKATSYIILASLIFFGNIEVTQAKTLGDLKKELVELQKKAEQTQNNLNQTNQQIGSTQDRIQSISARIEKTNNEIIKKTADIDYNNGQIAMRNDQIKSIMDFYQNSDGNINYMEFIFGAKSFTDLIRRLSAVSSITQRNRELMDQMEALVKELNIQKQELANLKVQLEKDKKEFNSLLATLNDKKAQLSDLYVDEQTSIKQQLQIVKMYEDLGCKDTDEIDACAANKIPPGATFIRPMTKGYITSEWGWRKDPFGGGAMKLHSGIDVAGVPNGSDIFATAPGLVADVFYNSSGGKQVVIHHIINGEKYSSLYAHMDSQSVKKGQTVDATTKVGTMGATGNVTGAHLHFTILKGHFLKDYGWDKYSSYTINPRDKVNFPASLREYFYDRMTKY